MRKLTLTNHVQSDTTVLENEFIDHYMAEANGEYVKVYLILLRHLNEPSGTLTISKIADFPVEVIVGPEVVTGSTRMKSGTAQKMVLNMISTGVMIKLGKVYGNLMIDVKATNEKLVERAKGIIMKCTGVTRNVAEEYMSLSGNDVRLSIFMILSKLNKEESINTLYENNNNIRKALESLK